jgi:hypothetical protein
MMNGLLFSLPIINTPRTMVQVFVTSTHIATLFIEQSVWTQDWSGKSVAISYKTSAATIINPRKVLPLKRSRRQPSQKMLLLKEVCTISSKNGSQIILPGSSRSGPAQPLGGVF